MLISLTRALPKALKGMDPADVIARANKNGEELSRRLHDLLATLGKEQPQAQPAPALPDIITLTLGGRTYTAPRIIADGEKVTNKVVIKRAKDKKVVSGQEDAEWFLSHQGEIPAELRHKVVFVFSGWCDHDDFKDVTFVYWSVDRWHRDWDQYLHRNWDGFNRPVGRSA